MTHFVYGSYTQEALNSAYNQREWAPNAAELINSWRESASLRQGLGCREVAYGPGDRQKLDIYPAPGSSAAPVHFHVHGGAWRMLDKEACAFIVPAQQKAGMATVIPDFDLLPHVSMSEMSGQILQSFLKVVERAPDFGGDVSRIVVSGHSSGAHLAALLAAADLTRHGLAADCIKALVLISGPYDLEPVLKSSRRDYIHLEPGEAAALNAYARADSIDCPVRMLYGEAENPEFIRQSQSMAHRLTELGKTVTCSMVANVNHFEIMDLLRDADSQVSRAVQQSVPDAPGRCAPDAGRQTV